VRLHPGEHPKLHCPLCERSIYCDDDDLELHTRWAARVVCEDAMLQANSYANSPHSNQLLRVAGATTQLKQLSRHAPKYLMSYTIEGASCGIFALTHCDLV
jgi:hypothetical protein